MTVKAERRAKQAVASRSLSLPRSRSPLRQPPGTNSFRARAQPGFRSGLFGSGFENKLNWIIQPRFSIGSKPVTDLCSEIFKFGTNISLLRASFSYPQQILDV